ncbi:MAG TPA: dihydrofolate reductase [Bacteroidota bacterium]|nr:dihydrofolate reductase [Bacteroidota bacterium]
MKLAIIAALAHNRVIGKAGKLPWHISEDLRRFKRLTGGHTVLMGRTTWESLGRPLPGRRNVVLSSGQVSGVEAYASLPDALRALSECDTVFVIGGGKVYAQLLDRADELHLTLVHQEVEGDAFFPPYEHLLGTVFVEVARENHQGFEFVDYVRARP